VWGGGCGGGEWVGGCCFFGVLVWFFGWVWGVGGFLGGGGVCVFGGGGGGCSGVWGGLGGGGGGGWRPSFELWLDL